jgi:TolB-like protein
MPSIKFLNKVSALAVAAAVCCTACSALMRPVSDAAPRGGEKPRFAVLPLVNMSGQPAPVKEMRQALMRGFVAEGGVVFDDEDLERFMVRHRVRYTGGIDAVTARALREEAGVGAVLITTLEQYADTRPPAIALTSRLVATGDTPIILWMETVGMSGDDSPGLLGVGLLNDIALLQSKAFARLTGSFAKFLARGTGAESRRGDRRFLPKTVYSSPFMRPGRKYTIAVAPFLNRSERNDADEFLALHVLCQLTKVGTFDVIDPGAVREKLLFFRFILQEGLSVRQADLIHNSLAADLILTGKAMEYRDSGGTPGVEFDVLVFERKNKKIVWTSWSANKGDDGVFFFDWGRVRTAAALEAKMAQAVVQDMTARGSIKDGQLPEEQPSSRGPWDLDRDDFPAR